MEAVSKGHLEVVGSLLEGNADINLKDEYGRTAFDIAKEKKEMQ